LLGTPCNWDEITELEKDNMTRMNMNNFFCSLHYIVGLADCAEETLEVWEANSSVHRFGFRFPFEF